MGDLAGRRIVPQEMDGERGGQRLGVPLAGEVISPELSYEPPRQIFDVGIARAEVIQELDLPRAVRIQFIDDARNERGCELQLHQLGFFLMLHCLRLARGCDDVVPSMHGPLNDAPMAPLQQIDWPAEEYRDHVLRYGFDEIDVADPVELDQDAVPLQRPARQERFGNAFRCAAEARRV